MTHKPQRNTPERAQGLLSRRHRQRSRDNDGTIRYANFMNANPDAALRPAYSLARYTPSPRKANPSPIIYGVTRK